MVWTKNTAEAASASSTSGIPWHDAFTHAKSDSEPVSIADAAEFGSPEESPAIPQARNIQVNSIICVWGMKK